MATIPTELSKESKVLYANRGNQPQITHLKRLQHKTAPKTISPAVKNTPKHFSQNDFTCGEKHAKTFYVAADFFSRLRRIGTAQRFSPAVKNMRHRKSLRLLPSASGKKNVIHAKNALPAQPFTTYFTPCPVPILEPCLQAQRVYYSSSSLLAALI